jgi:hypothetical protein
MHSFTQARNRPCSGLRLREEALRQKPLGDEVLREVFRLISVLHRQTRLDTPENR